MPRLRLFAVTILAACCLQGCYHARLLADPEAQVATSPKAETAWVMWWGLSQPRLTAPECLSGGLQEVRVSTNVGYSLITILTLGIACPVDVEYSCAKPCPVEPDPQ